MTTQTKFDPLTLEILWQRLITVVDEMASIVVRTSFSTVIGAANDFGCEVMDAQGRSLAHATRSMPVFNQTLPHVTQAVIEKFGIETMRPGDVFITNDPWLCAGHNPDIAVMTPFFRNGELMGFAASVAHVSDAGGMLDSNLARESYDEGLLIPMARLYNQGQLNEVILDFIAQNVRVSESVIGDVQAQVTANQAGGQKMLALMDEYGLADLRNLSDEIQNRSEKAMRASIAKVPDGDYRSRVVFNEFDGELEIQCKISVQGDELTADFAGSSPQQPKGGINCTFVYSRGQASYGLKCILLPDVPSNGGCFRPIEISAPQGSILNCTKPASVRMRTRTGWYIHNALFAALAPVLPDQVMAPSGFIGGATVFAHPKTSNGTGEKTLHSWFFNGGGMGAGSTTDGVSTCIYPSSASNVPIELFEVAVPILVEQKEFLTDSGGPGKQRGGLGLQMALRKLESFDGEPVVSLWLHGQSIPPLGLNGGGEANAAQVYIDGQELSEEERAEGTGLITLDSADTLIAFTTTGGGGFGEAKQRNRALVAEDLRNGLISEEKAATEYGYTFV
ncbi:MAG: hydantoinase B/oxoprolinase family protein [Chloroflexota bacterium]